MRFEFAGFTLDEEEQTLTGPDGPVALRRMSMRVLCALVQAAPGTVDKAGLISRVWGHQSLSASSLPHTIRELREALGDSAHTPRFIETRQRMGYRFIAPIRIAQACPHETLGERTRDDSQRDDALSAVLPASELAQAHAPDDAEARVVSTRSSQATSLAVPTPQIRRRAAFIAAVALTALAIVAGLQLPDDQREQLSESLSSVARSSAPSAQAITASMRFPFVELVRGASVVEAGVDAANAEHMLARLDARLASLGAARVDAATKPSPDRVRYLLSTRLIIADDDQLRFRADLSRERDGRRVRTISELIAPHNRDERIDYIANAVVERMVFDLAGESGGQPTDYRPVGPALESFLDAQAALRNEDLVLGRSLLERSADADPDAPVTHMLLSRVLMELGEMEKARAAIDRATASSRSLPYRKQLIIEATRRELTDGHDAALRVWNALVMIDPAAHTVLGCTFDAALTAKDFLLAERTLEQVRASAAWSPVSLELARAELAERRADEPGFAKAANAAAQAAASNPASCCHKRVELAMARAEGVAGQISESKRRLARLIAQCVVERDLRCQGQAQLARARLDGGGNPSHAIEADLQAAQTAFAEAGDRRGETKVLQLRAERALDAADPALSLSLFGTLETIAETLGDHHSLLTAKLGAAKALAHMNDAPAARRKLSEAALLARERGFGSLLDEAAALDSTIKR